MSLVSMLDDGKHPSDSAIQREAETWILADVGRQLGVELVQGNQFQIGTSWIQVDGVDDDRSALVEVFARVGRLHGAQFGKVCTDALKLLALRESLPEARLVLAFADQLAADSIVGWRAVVLHRNGISIMVAKLSETQRKSIEEVQHQQRMINRPLPVRGVDRPGPRGPGR